MVTIFIITLVVLCLLTCIIELIPFLFLSENGKWIKASFLCNVITNPIANVILIIAGTYITNQTALICIAVALEIVVVAYEAYMYHHIMDASIVKSVVMSVIANAASFIVGLLIILALFEPVVPIADRLDPIAGMYLA